MASDLPFGCDRDDDEIRVQLATDNNDDNDFNLGESYQNAVDCLIQCELLIESLQEQLASKDEHIASLEEKLVQMSLDPAPCNTNSRKERIQQEIEKCKELKVRELKKELESYGISTTSYIEKSEFEHAVAEARVDEPKK